MKHANGHCHRSTSSPSDLLRQLLFLPTPPQSGPPLETLVPDCGLRADSQLPWGSGGGITSVSHVPLLQRRPDRFPRAVAPSASSSLSQCQAASAQHDGGWLLDGQTPVAFCPPGRMGVEIGWQKRSPDVCCGAPGQKRGPTMALVSAPGEAWCSSRATKG